MFNKRSVFWFLGLNISLTWLLSLAIYLLGGKASPGVITALQFFGQLPAFSAILLSLFFFPESPIYYKQVAGRGRWFYYFFLLYTVIFALALFSIWLSPEGSMITLLASQIPMLFSFLALLLLIILRAKVGHQAMTRIGLAWGSLRYWLLFGLAFVAFYVIQVILNAIFGLGPVKAATIAPPTGMSSVAFLVMNIVNILLGLVFGIILAFGEEYGWRGYLQSELFKLGRARGVLLLGVIWGIWHWPIILMGHNYPEHPLLGLPLMVLYSTSLGVFLSYAVLKTGSVLLAAFLHGVNNLVANTIVSLGYGPYDSVLSFFTGVYGIATAVILAIVVLRDPIWRGKGSNLAQLAMAPTEINYPEKPGTVEKEMDFAKSGNPSSNSPV